MPFVSTHALIAVVVSSVVLCLASIAVTLRQYAQILKGNPFGADAWSLMVALAVSAGLVGLTIYGAEHAGLGWPARMLLGPVGLKFQKVVYAGQILWSVSITLVRVSLLLFYRRVFPVQHFLLADSIMLGICGGWWISNFVATLLTYKWSATSQTSINYPAFLLVNAVINMVLDIATLCLPLFIIRTLHISKKRKIVIGGIFWLGIFCIAASIVRVYYFVQLSHITQKDRSFSETTYYCFIWSVVEPCVSIIAACLPASAPLINKETRGFSTLFNSLISLFQSRGTQQDSDRSKFVGSTSGGNGNANESKFNWRIYTERSLDDMEMCSRTNDDRSSQRSTSRLA
ncbi:hypothetical protein CC78DRAFT_537472 [Lojkania enalia]|uniref:Rhodopsin domain-containing protein n=1 Tax=Lojkania enalia TaxID=147567 RepID=A0A9P4MYU8_9PLEO|nr:hypothetical protein CC78DRAFT_537472 [Didymosphaeria enalia]